MSYPYTIYEVETGAIVGSRAVPQEHLRTPEGPLEEAPGLAVLHVASDPATQRIEGGEVVGRSVEDLAAEAAEAAARAVREHRFGLLQRHVDQISGLRWSEMTAAERTALRAYRQALLDMPETGEVPQPPSFSPLALARQRALGTMLSRLEAKVEAVIGDVPQSEMLSWPVKEAAARRFIDGTAAPEDLALLDAEAAVTGETRMALAARVVERADAYRALTAQLSGLRRRVTEAIEAATSRDEIRAALAPLRALQE